MRNIAATTFGPVMAMVARTGGSFFHHADSVAMMRGGHLDICVLGAFQVAANGDRANGHTGAADAIPAVGGAMGLAIDAQRTFVTMEHLTKAGESKLVERCSHPLTGLGCVCRVCADLAVIDLRPQGPAVVQMCEGMVRSRLQALTSVALHAA